MVIKVFSKINIPDVPPKEITMDGVIYSRIDIDNVSMSWDIDFQETNQNDAVRYACLFYHPKGEIYGDEHENGMLKHPIRSKYAIFEEHFPLEVYLSCTAFFLRKLEKRMRLYTVKQLQANKEKKLLKWLKKCLTLGRM